MHNDFKNISEATLWDNLKRKVNKGLKKLENDANSSQVLNHFEGKYPKEVQRILKHVGREFFKIFLYKAIEQNLNNKKGWQSKKKIIHKTVEDFRFYFYPGYTTLAGRRVFMVGNKRNGKSDDRFFTGIGNNNIEVKDFGKICNYLLSREDNQFNCFVYKKPFWVDDIPSTIAFDSVLGQTYLNKTLDDVKFLVPSTHFWKSSQIRPNGEYIPMPLSSDNSEMRILKVSIGEKAAEYANNQISIYIRPENLLGSGTIIADRLNRENVRIAWSKPEDKNHYVPWPFRTADSYNSDSHLKELQLAAYSYWLSETLDLQNPTKLNYKPIRKMFKANGFTAIADRIIPYKHFYKNYAYKNGITELYYQNWYTLFLESYGKNMDLGTAMFLCSDSFEPAFLNKCANWLRWIYNELRLIEATAKEEIETKEETEEQEYGKLAHNTKLLFPYLKGLIQSTDTNNLDKTLPILLSELEGLEETVKVTFYSNNIPLFKQHYPMTAVNLKQEIEHLVKLIKYDIFNNNGKIIKLTADNDFQRCIREAVANDENPLFDISIGENQIVGGHRGPFAVILKDLIGNAVKHSTSEIEPGTPLPVVKISSFNSGDNIVLEISNSLPISDDAITVWRTGKIPPNSPLNLCYGLKIAATYCKHFDITKSISSNETNNETTFGLKFRRWIN
jgi:hypothetical protein